MCFPRPELPMPMPLIIINDLALHRIPIAVADVPDVAAVTDTMPAQCSVLRNASSSDSQLPILRFQRSPFPYPRSFLRSGIIDY